MINSPIRRLKGGLAVPFLSLLLALGFANGCQQSLYDPPKSPQESLASFDIIPEFQVELFASEPHVQDPVDMTIDEQGRIYAVEMPDYPFKPKPGEGKCRIKQLIDRDGDGVIDSSIVFIDRISEATSILRWRAGLLIAAAPNILFAADTDGDGQADSTEIIFSGFFENNSEAQITNLKFGIDNWIYASNHGQAGEIHFTRDPEKKPLQIRGGDFRFRLDKGQFEVVTGPAQFGQAFNNRGHRFVTQNTLHLQHVVVPWRYVHRHPYLPPNSYTANISDHELEMFQQTPPPYWRAERTRRRQKRYKEQGLDRVEYAEDHFTGCSGGTFYAGHTFSAEFYGSIFTGDVAGNLIHCDILEILSGSPTYVGKRAPIDTDREFLMSTDSWFRPTHFYVGPDGSLYVVDFYRQHIETPLSIPEDLKADMDFMQGSDLGRIYRIQPGESYKSGSKPAPLGVEDADLADLLTHANRWHRLQAQRLILEQQDTGFIPKLRSLLDSAEFDQARLHAFYALEGLGAMDFDLVRQALSDPYPGLREHGVIMAERFESALPFLLDRLDDEDIRVVFQACLSLGQFSDDQRVLEGLANVIKRHGTDPWFRLAVLSSHAGSSLSLLDNLLERQDFDEVDTMLFPFIQELGYVVARRRKGDEGPRFLDLLLATSSDNSDNWILRAKERFLEGVIHSGQKMHSGQRLNSILTEFQNSDSPRQRKLATDYQVL